MPEPILVISVMRDEGPNLLHWIAHNRAAGVDRHLIFTNDCADGTDRLLDLLAPAGVAHVANTGRPGRTPQWSALKLAQTRPEYAGAGWIAVLDCDEYINLRPPLATLRDLVAAAAADAVVLPWRLFGHGGHATRPQAPPTRAFTAAIPEDALFPPLARYFKTFYRRAAFRAPGIHRPKPLAAPARWADGSGRPLPESFATGRRIMLWGGVPASALVQLNHYSVRSAEEFLAKSARGLPNHGDKPVDLTYWVERNFNEVEDVSILRMEPAAAAELARLRALPGVAAAEQAARDWHRGQFRQALVRPETLALYGRLLMAAGSRAPDPRTARALVRLYGRAHDPAAPPAH